MYIHLLLEQLDEAPITSVNSVWYRYHNPNWGWTPYAGTGAKLAGGRFNPTGVSALYLADSPETALKEVTTGAGHGLIQPWLLCSYAIHMDRVLDIRPYGELFNTPWRLQKLQQSIPPGWLLCRQLKQQKQATGLLVPSYQSNGTNLVVLRYQQSEIQAYDPEKRLSQLFGNQFTDEEWG